MQAHDCLTGGQSERERERASEGEEGASERAKATNWVNMPVHKQSRTPKPAMTHWGAKLAPTCKQEKLWGVCKHTHIHSHTHKCMCKQKQGCAITGFITAAHINVETHLPIGTIMVLT